MEDRICKYINLIETYVKTNYKKCFREPYGKFKYKCIVPGASYTQQLWDWDSWLTDVAVYEIADEDIFDYETGCVLNFLDAADKNGRIPINIMADRESVFDLKPGTEVNIHKPCLAAHALFIVKKHNGNVEWLKGKFNILKNFIKWYDDNCFHKETGLYFWINDFAIGVDNDPCVFYRPDKSTAAIFLNSLMYNELNAMSELCSLLGDKTDGKHYCNKAEELKAAIQKECWDSRDNFFYSTDINLKPINPEEWLHCGGPRHWNSLRMRIEVWTGFLPLWNKIATEEQARLIVNEHYLNKETFNAPYGVRSLSKKETDMYVIKKSGNPSCWLGPIWINCNYFVFKGLLNYGYTDLAKELAEKTVILLGQDLEKNGDIHEYYHPETGEGVNNKGFQSWNLLSYNMAKWLKTFK